MNPFLHQVALELERARTKHPPRQNSLHESYAVILEELDEFWDLVRLQTSERDPAELLTELIQIAAMAARAAEDNGLIATTYDEPMRFRIVESQQ